MPERPQQQTIPDVSFRGIEMSNWCLIQCA